MEKRKNQRRRRILAELKGWCEKELGDGYSVEVANSKNAGGSYDTAVVVTKNNESNTIGVASGATHPSRIVQEARQPYEDTQDFAQFDSKIRNKSEYAEGLSQLSSEIEQKNLAHMSFCTVELRLLDLKVGIIK